jgi:endo-1,4-beta-mannosidase
VNTAACLERVKQLMARDYSQHKALANWNHVNARRVRIVQYRSGAVQYISEFLPCRVLQTGGIL